VQRSFTYGLYGAVLAGIIGGPVAWGQVDKTVQLVVDGQSRAVNTSAADVQGVLAAAGYHAGPHDLVAPAASAPVHDGSRVVLRRGRLLILDVNGVRTRIWTTAATVREAVGQLGYAEADFISVSRSQRLPLTPTDVTVRTPMQLMVVHDGMRQEVTTTAGDASQLFADLGVRMRSSDRLSVSATAPLRAGETIRLTRVDRRTITKTVAVPFPTRKIADAKMASGRTVVVTPGRNGSKRISYAMIYVDGKYAGRTKTGSVMVKAPRRQVVHYGTKHVAPKVPVVSGTPVSPGSAQALARSLLGNYGWGDDQWGCLQTIWNHESGWRVHAANPSGAYGIPQALPGSKMGPGWQDDAGVQIRWGLGYIKARYVSPCGAWSFWQGHNWY
jgi:resuscitation-promoting factor RpfB